MVRIWSDAGLPYKPKGRESRESIAAEIEYAGAVFFGLFENDRMVGVAIANWDGRRGWLIVWRSDPDCRGRGLAGELIRVCEQFLEGQGLKLWRRLSRNITCHRCRPS